MGSEGLDNLRFLPRLRLNGERTLSGSDTCCPRVVEKRDRKGSDGDFAACDVVMCPFHSLSPVLTTKTENGDARLSGLATQRDQGAESIRCEWIRTADQRRRQNR